MRLKEGTPPVSTSTQRHNSKNGLWGIPLYPHWDFDTIKYFYEVHVHEWTQHGEQTGGARDLCAVTALWSHCNYKDIWDSSHDWNVVMNSCKLFGKNRLESTAVGLPSMWDNIWNVSGSVLGWMMSKLRAFELGQKGRIARVTLLWVFATGSWSGGGVDKALYRQLGAASQALVLVGEFNHPDTAGGATPWKHWRHPLTQIVGLPTRKNNNLTIKHRESLAGNGSDIY